MTGRCRAFKTTHTKHDSLSDSLEGRETMRTLTSIVVLLFAIIFIFSACSLVRRDMYDSGDDGSKGSTAKITIDVDDGLKTNESGGTDIFTIALALAPTADVTFPFTSGDTDEVIVSPSSVTFTTTDWSTPRVVTVQGVADGVADGHKPVPVVIGPASSSDKNWSGFDPADVTVYNIDIDSASTPGVTVSASGPLLLSEIGTLGSFAVLLNSKPTGSVSIPISVSDDTEATIISPFAGPSDFLVFTSTDWSTPQVVLVTGVDDPTADGNYDGTIYVQAAISSDPLYNGFEPPDVLFTTIDDDAPGVTVSADPTVYVSESGTVGSFTVVLNSAPAGDVVMTVSVSDATEGVLGTPATITFNTTTKLWDVPQTVTVQGVDDSEYDGLVTYPVYVTMDAGATMDGAYDAIDPSDVNFATTDDDAAGVTVSEVTSALVSESGTDSSFTVVLNSQPTSTVTINVSVPDTTEGTITEPAPGGSSTTLTFTSGNWYTAQTVTVAGVNDAVADGNVGFTVMIGATSSADPAYNGSINPPDIVLANVDDDSAGVTVSAGTTMVSESGTSATFTMVLNSEPAANVSFSLSIGDLTEGVFTSPFAGTTGSVAFTSTDWSTAKAVTVSGVDDGVSDGHQTFWVNFGASSSADPDYNGTFTPPSVSFTCIDDMGGPLIPGVVVQALDDPLVVSESGSSASFQVVLIAPPAADVDIPVSVGATSEGLITSPAWGASGTITFTTFNWSTPYTVTVTGQNDFFADGNQDFWINLGNTVSGDAAYNGLTVQDVQCRCIDDDGSPGVTVIAGPTSYVSESGTSASFNIVLNTAPTAVVVMNVSVDDTTEGALTAPASGTLTFDQTNWNLPQTVTVQGVDDPDVDGNAGFKALLTMNTTATLDPSYDPIDPDDANYVCIDDEVPGITVNSGTNVTLSESGTSTTFTVVLNSRPAVDVKIDVEVSDSSEAVFTWPLAAGYITLTFTTSNWSTAQSVTVQGLDDSVVDGDVAYSVILHPAVAPGDAYYNGLDSSDIAFTTVDDDSPGITVNVGDGLITKEDPVAPLSDTFTVVLNSQPTAPVTIQPIMSANTGEVTVSTVLGDSIVFDGTNWNIEQIVTVRGVNEWVTDDFQVVDVTFGAVTSGDPSYNGMTIVPVRVYNLDDDMGTARRVIILPSPPGGWVTTENGAGVEIPVLLNSMPAGQVDIGPITWDPIQADVSLNVITFNPANWNVPQVVRVTGRDDGIASDVLHTVDFGTTTCVIDLAWNGIPAGTADVLNRRFLAAAPSYVKSPPTPKTYNPLTGANQITFTKTREYDPKDDGACSIPIGFTFHYMGVSYDRMIVCTNGFVTFNPTPHMGNSHMGMGLFSNDPDYYLDLYNRILAPWWDDLTLVDAGSNAYYKTEVDLDNPPNRMLTVEWVNAKAYSKAVVYSFQLVLKEGTDVIEFRYGPKTGTQSKTATAGIKDNLGGNGHFLDILGKTTAPPNPYYDNTDFYTGQFISYNPYP